MQYELNQKPNLPKLTGVFIPVDILISDSLSPFDKLLLAYIMSFNEFFQKNETIAQIFGVSVPTVTRSIKTLKEQKLISIIDFNGTKRILKSLIKMIIQPNQIDYPPNQNDYPIYNKLTNKIYKEKYKKEKDKSTLGYATERTYTQEQINKVIDKIEDISF